MKEHKPDQYTVLGAVALANRAPSVHNSQPWRWLLGEESVHLMADRGRWPAPDLLLSCGAALHHLRVAMAAFGWRSIVHHLPNPGDPDHLASVEFAPKAAPSTEVVTLAGAISRRRTDRRRFTDRPVAAEHVDLVVERAERAGALLVPVTDQVPRKRLTHAIDEVIHARTDRTEELAGWPGVRGTSASASGRAHGDTDTMRVSRTGTLAGPAPCPDGGELLILASREDDLVSTLRAGEAASAALLTATSLGLATCPLSLALELADLRTEFGDGVLGGAAHPQLILRTGWAPATALPTPRSPRRATSDTVGYLPGTHRPAHIPPPREMP
ncbi:Acg family FMN-binding oxidoreductase [Actinophytocola sp.]|uniref:Acg family FMN-binding oxidoreductase n=1 Tax=Actinophytocola sp. TaxID=1872138 RepID=UPI00389A2E8E